MVALGVAKRRHNRVAYTVDCYANCVGGGILNNATTQAPGANATTINYQGRLADNGGTPINGNPNLTFALYDAVTSGNLIWGVEAHNSVPVNDGLFNVGLGSQTSGGIPTTVWDGDRYLEIAVNGEILTPREPIRSVPIAGMALTVPDGAIGTDQLQSDAITQEKTTGLLGSVHEDRKLVRFTYVGLSDASGILTIDVSGFNFTSLDSVVVSNGDDAAMAGSIFNLISWNMNEIKLRVWYSGGSVASNRNMRANVFIVGQ